MQDQALIDRIATLRRSVSARKKAIKQHREALVEEASELAALEERCRQLGIGLTFAPRQGAPQA